jgi:hypothetical protein
MSSLHLFSPYFLFSCHHNSDIIPLEVRPDKTLMARQLVVSSARFDLACFNFFHELSIYQQNKDPT